MKKLISIIVLSSILTACATNRKSKWLMVGVAAPVGAGVGALSAPHDEKTEFHAITWAGIFFAAATILGDYYYNDDKELANLRSKIKSFENPKFELITEGTGSFKDPLTKNSSPVNWKVYKIDKWVSDGEDTKYHQDLMIKKEKGKAKENE